MLEEQDQPFTQEVSLRGFVRVTVVDRATGTVVEDTGFRPNKITARGFQDMVGAVLIYTNTASHSHPGWAGLGLHGASPNSAFTSFATTGTAMGMIASQNKVTNLLQYGATTDGGIVRMQASWAGSAYVNGATTANIDCIAMFHTSATNASALCAATFSALSWLSQHDVHSIYDLKFTQ